LIRYADDSIAVFEFEDDARRFIVLPKRLEKFGLRLNEAKTQLLFGKRQAAGIQSRERLPPLIFSASPIIGKKSDRKSSIEAKDHKKDFVVLWRPSSVAAPGTQRSCYLRSGKAIGQSCVDISTTLGSPTTVVRYTALNGRYTLCS